MKTKIISLSLLLLLIGCNSTPKKKSSAKANTPVKSIPPKAQPAIVDYSDMVKIAGGDATIGNNSLPIAAPQHKVKISPFYIDKTEVTVGAFRKFVKATRFKTDADKFGNSGVFDMNSGGWQLVTGANWEYPLGRNLPKAKDNEPVTQVSWRDANAYAQWLGKRLPTEQEWEYAASAGGKNVPYACGSTLKKGDKYLANYWQGDFTPQSPEVSDKFLFSGPVKSFDPNALGLYDMCGNVWEWTSSVMQPYPGAQNTMQVNPQVRVLKGGSFFFDQIGEESLTVYFRMGNTTETSLFNTGFRCAASAEE